MSARAPGFEKHPNYQVEITPTTDHIQVFVGDRLIADSQRPLRVIESKHHPVWYLPLADVRADAIAATDHSTYCPFKGHARYWSITGTADDSLENTVWGYDAPYVECEPLENHVAFYTDKVDLHLNGESQSRQGPGWSD